MFEEIEAALDEVGVEIDAINASVDLRFAGAERSAALRHREFIAKLDELQRLIVSGKTCGRNGL